MEENVSAAPQAAVAALALTSGAIHAARAVADAGVKDLAWLFWLNAGGYAGLAARYLTAGNRGGVRRLLLVYTAATFVTYFLLSLTKRNWSLAIGPITKAIELPLILLLLSEERASQSRSDLPE